MMRPLLRAAVAATIAGTLASRALGAQTTQATQTVTFAVQPAPLAASHPEARSAEPGSAVTIAVRVTNVSSDTLTVTPRVFAPVDWSTLLGTFPFVLAPHEGDTWLVSVRIPARAAAGRYGILLRAEDAARHTLIADSVWVDVKPRHKVELTLAERPSYAVSGSAYRGVFLVQNKGNVPATLALKSSSLLGSSVDAPRELSLDANESRLVHVGAVTVVDGQEARDEVIELRATDVADTSAHAGSSMRLTIVQRPGTGDQLHTVGATLRLRAADASAGVSPYELSGGGQLREGGTEQIDFLMRGKAALGSPFGDREEYHLGIRGKNFSTMVGDGVYSASPLTSAGQRGFGGVVNLGDDLLGGSAYTQRFSALSGSSGERGLTLRAGSDDLYAAPRVAFSAVTRNGGGLLPGNLLGASTRLHPGAGVALDMEYAASSGPSGRGGARSLRLSRDGLLHVDFGHLDADSNFAGSARGSTYDFVNLNTKSWRDLRLNATAASTQTVGSLLALGTVQQFTTSTLEISHTSGYSLGYTTLARHFLTGEITTGEAQQGVVARADRTFGLAHLWGTGEVGRARDSLVAPTHGYEQLTLGVSAPFGPHVLSLYGETSQGAAATRGAARIRTIGADAQLQFGPTTSFTIGGSATKSDVPQGGYAQVDARLVQLLPTGASVSMRLRLGGRDLVDAAMGQKLAFLEYSTPLHLPIGPSRAPGRVQGRVVDQQTGRGVAGALVRLGPQAAITDDDGHVAFAGLPAGAYRISLGQQLSNGSSVFTGDPDVHVDSTNRNPAVFHVAVEPAGTVSGTVRRMLVARTGLGTAPDSLVDGGPLEGVSVALAGAKDTLYRNTDASGTFEFTDVPSGTWTVIVMAETPSQTAWELESIPVVMRAGQKATVKFRLMPKRRRVRIVSGDGIDEKSG
ncbi:MAG: isocitrate dehydrogenase, NADP-dependent, partial [Gemmatimonadetes bacterium]|nr:isocitrate dehydrogenase, NADP-dependent [Gemmatimonadota bacterium]